MNDTPPAARLFDRVSRDRALQGISWAELSRRTGLARSTVHSWAHITTPPQPDKVNAVADLLGIPRAEALALAGILVEPGRERDQAALHEVSDEALVAEVSRRLAARTARKGTRP